MDYKDELNKIEIPEEIDLIIEKAIRRAKNRHKNFVVKTAAVLAASLALFVLLNNISPTFAKYVDDTSATIKNLFSKFNDRGINTAVKNGFVQGSFKDKNELSNSVSDKGITVTINQLAIDKNELIVGYTSKANNSYKWNDLNQEILQITDDSGKLLYDGRDFDEIMNDRKNTGKTYDQIVFYNGSSKIFIGQGNFKSYRKKQMVMGFASTGSTKLSTIPKSINIKFTYCSDKDIVSVREYYRHGYIYRIFHKSPKVINGNWSINIKIDDKFINAKEIKYVKAQETSENSSIIIDSVNLYPISAYGSFFIPNDWAFKNLYLQDDEGNVYGCKSFGEGDNNGGTKEITANFQSPYFKDIKKLYLGFTYKKNGVDKNIKIELKRK
ncbi:DUF4179 domain-containing protein [Clostridium kluyveri]|uniref:DUF4179 domain-containing protein n=1 Tax=Clostridium kluyveri TaxID=1534 RepID=UPI0022450142|nr:DUF4179 domain-containing protein [Clostridium kluyveri]UZQ50434.1 DUF4179 domain-containing protein [Clostridium kluyveri]